MLLALATLVVAGLSSANNAGQARGRQHRLRGQLGLQVVRELPSTQARLERVRQFHGDAVMGEVKRRLQAMGVIDFSAVSRIDSMIPWLALHNRASLSPQLLECEYWRELRDWYVVVQPDLAQLSLVDALAGARRWHENMVHELEDMGGGLVPSGEVVFAWDDGWTVQQVDDLKVLLAEGRTMQNCLKHGAYDEEVESGELTIYSLRGPSAFEGGPSRPRVTMAQSSEGSWVEVKGRQNKPPDQKYRGRVREFLRSRHGGEMPTSEMSELIWILTREEALGDPKGAYVYARDVDEAPRDDTRAAALGDPKWAYFYAMDVDEAPRDDTRAAVLGDPGWAYEYARFVDRAPRDDTRAAVLGDPVSAYRYAKHVDKAPRDDTRAAALGDPVSAYFYARSVDRAPRDDTRAAALGDPKWAYQYALRVDEAPRDDTRAAALGDPRWAYQYARDVDKAPRDDTRAAALGDPGWAYRYALLVDEAPRDDTRAAALVNPKWAYEYARYFDEGL